ncbi:MAG: hypothetical protein FJ009_03195 [Chloroflexi bacterium]|nr:hypothetical protein [Chloroflexota bacterium]
MPNLNSGTQIGNYVIIKALEDGQGGMAQVYLARPSAEEQTEENLVALKITRTADERAGTQDTHFFDALSNEVENLIKLRHPNINRLLPVQTEARTTPYIARANNIHGRPWYCVMEYLTGGSLANELDRGEGGRLALNLAVEIVYQIGLALEYIHLKGVAHLDVKPDNILFRKLLFGENKPEPVLIDFGIARKENQTGLPAGAASYMAPERIMLVRGDIPRSKYPDQRPADVYSLAIVLYRSVTGKLPFAKRDKSTTTDVILKEEPVPASRYLKDIPPALEDTIMRALQKDPTRRITMAEFLSALDSAVPPPRWKPTPKSIKEMGMPEPIIVAPRSRSLLPLITGIGGLAVGSILAALIFMLVLNSSTGTAASQISAAPTASPRLPAPTEKVAVSIAATPPPASFPPTVTPFPTFTPAASATPYNPAAPGLTSPGNNQVFEGSGARPVLTWTGPAELPENVYYVLTFTRNAGSANPRREEYALREKQWTLPPGEYASIAAGTTLRFEWSVAIKRAIGVNIDGSKQWDPMLNVSSPAFVFSWRSPTPAPTATWTPPPMPTVRPTQERSQPGPPPTAIPIGR